MAGGVLGQAAPRAYIASPFFTPEQIAAVGEVVVAVEGCGYVTYSPMRDGILLKPTDPPKLRDEVYWSNVCAIRESQLLVAILDVKDTGTIWELGAATGYTLPIVAVTLAVETMNVMLERGVAAHVKNLHDLTEVLTRLRPYLVYGRKVTNNLRMNLGTLLTEFATTYTYSGKTR